MISRTVSFLALLLAVAPAGAAQETHRYVPDHFFNTYSGAHPPALRIKPGDRVVTKTIDAAGVDWDGKPTGTGGNPETGPFYIEGAEPGDMLVVRVEKIGTNRARCSSSATVTPAWAKAKWLARGSRPPWTSSSPSIW